MSRTEARRWLMLGLTAFTLRASLAVLTERTPIFPPYYYHDAAFAERLAAETVASWKRGTLHRTWYSPAQRVHAALIAGIYMVVGHRPLAAKMVNAVLGAASVVFLGFVFAAAFPERAAFIAAALVAAWPSHLFYTSQNFKESAMFACVFGGLALLLPALEKPPRRWAILGGLTLLLAAGMLRSYILIILCAAAAVGAFQALIASRGKNPGASWLLIVALAAPMLFKPLSYAIFTRQLPTPESAAVPEMDFVPVAVDPQGARFHPLSPRGISHFRLLRQFYDRHYAMKALGREIGTQIYPDAQFDGYLDIALFLPKAAFRILFMPLPGLYPMDGKLGRQLAACENLLLLALSLAGLAGTLRGPPSPPRTTLLVFFILMMVGSALLEFDLGSASRHKLLYFPMLFPFAAEEFLRRRRA